MDPFKMCHIIGIREMLMSMQKCLRGDYVRMHTTT